MQPRIVDNFLSDDELYYANEYLNEIRWRMQKSDLDGLEFLYCDVGHNDFFSNQLYKKLEKEIGVDLEL